MYYKKVEITGINTSALPVLTDIEREQLIHKMKNGDKRAKDMLVMANLKLVLSIIQKVNSRNIDRDDLFQVGCIGLIKALNNFDPELNVQFSTYGVVMILGEIKRYIRDNSIVKVSRGTKDLAYKALNYREWYIRENDTEPTTAEIAKRLGTTTCKISNALDAVSPAVSLYEPVFSDEKDGVYLLDQLGGENFEDEFSSKIIIQDVLHNLQKREKRILNLRYIQGKTQTQVADIIGISQAQVSRIEKNVLKRMKKQLMIQ
ncbi:MAG: sigma-70 family RNA polymerase sigma factor [Oscillospiraceae bacterium]|nr:sigma-70 family RNA polymerase sigma factor [Oscillospiraceae bacterium]